MKRFLAAVLAVATLLAAGLTGCNSGGTSTAKYKILDESLADEQYAIGFRKDDKALCAEVEKQLAAMKEDGTLKKISTTWFGSDISTVDAGKVSSGATDDSLQKIKDKGEFVLGLDDAFPPMGYRDSDNDIVGFDIDLAKEVCKRMGVTLKLQPINWSAKEQELSSGNIDCIWNGFTTTPERQAALCMSIPYMENRQVIVIPSDSEIQDVAGLAGKTLVIQGGSSAADALEAHPEVKATLKDGQAVEVDNNVTALFDLGGGGSDAVLMDEVVARYYISNPDAEK